MASSLSSGIKTDRPDNVTDATVFLCASEQCHRDQPRSIRERVSGPDSLTLSPPRPVCTLYHISHGEFAVIALFLAHFIPFFRLEGTTPRRRFSRQKVIITHCCWTVHVIPLLAHQGGCIK